MIPACRPLLRVLVVDDWADTAESLAVLVGMWGHEAVAANDGRAAVELAAAYRPHVVLLDLGLPGLDGCAVASLLRQAPLAAPFVVAMSGYAHLHDRALTAGCDRFLLKPPDLADLRALLDERVALLGQGLVPAA